MGFGRRQHDEAAPKAPMVWGAIEVEDTRAHDFTRDRSDSADEKSRFFRYDHLDRKLKRRHVTAIAFSGTIGIGLFISSGQIIAIGGSLGCVLSFICAGLIVVGVMRSLAELVSVNPTFSALMEYPRTYVDPALGFAVGVTYCLAQCASVAVLTSAAIRVAGNFNPEFPLTHGQKAGIVIGFYFATLLSNALGVKTYGNIERFVKWLKFIIIFGLFILMIVVNVGGGGPRTGGRTSNYTDHAFTPFFNPFGFNETVQSGNAEGEGISGTTGQFLAIWTCITYAVFGCMGGDIVIVSAGEAAQPRRDVPAAARFMYLAPISCYILLTFVLGFNINYSDPRLSHAFRNADGPDYVPHSPFIVVIQSTNLSPHGLSQLLSACFMFCAYTAGNTALYVSSRTLFGLVRTYGDGNNFILNTLGRTSKGHTPQACILVCSVAGFLAFLGLADDTFNQPILSLSSFFTSTIGCVYAAECIAYIRFWQGLRSSAERGQISRNDITWRTKHYRPSGQPFWAVLGLVGSVLIVLFTGWADIYIISARRGLRNSDLLKPNRLVAWDLVGAYSGPIIFFGLYLSYKYIHGTVIQRYKDYRGQYVFEEFDRNEEDRPDRGPKGFGGWVREVWSFIE